MIQLPRLRRLAPSLARAVVAGGILATTTGCPTDTHPPAAKINYPTVPKDTSLAAFLDGTIQDRTFLNNETPYAVSAYGLVGQLRGTGDCSAPASVRSYMSKELARHKFGDPTVPGYGNIT